MPFKLNYDRYYTYGKNVGVEGNQIPTLGVKWGHIYSPVKTSNVKVLPASPQGPYSTIMNWQSHKLIQYNGATYGQKDVEFEKFIDLPQKVRVNMEVAVSGKNVPEKKLLGSGWKIENARRVTISYDDFFNYIYHCRGEFSVCKNIFVATRNAWFSDKSSAFLAAGRPVVVQDTGFSRYLPVGEGLFAVNNVDEAAAAIEKIESNYERHAKRAREIAVEFLEAKNVMKSFLSELGIE
jgi:hypothetical protein